MEKVDDQSMYSNIHIKMRPKTTTIVTTFRQIITKCENDENIQQNVIIIVVVVFTFSVDRLKENQEQIQFQFLYHMITNVSSVWKTAVFFSYNVHLCACKRWL